MSTEIKNLEIRQEDDSHIITVNERKILDEGSIQQMGNDMWRVADGIGGAGTPSNPTGKPKIIVDMSKVDFVASLFLDKLIRLDRRLKGRGGDSVILTGVKPEIFDVFEITKLHKLFAFAKDVDAAKAGQFSLPGVTANTIPELSNQYVTVEKHGDAYVAQLQNRVIVTDAEAQAAGAVLLGIPDHIAANADHGTDKSKLKLVVDLSKVHFVSGALIGKLITLEKKWRGVNKNLITFSAMKPEIYEVYALSHLNKLYDFKDTLQEALTAPARTRT